METIECILGRRSIRKFIHKPVTDQQINTLLKAAMYSPTARNTQSWRFVVINDHDRLVQLSQIHPYAKMLEQASVAILVCGDRQADSNDAYLVENGSAATQNILLAAYDLGLGSVWLGIYPREERMKDVSEFVKLPAEILPVSLIAIGYPDEQKPIPDRFDANKIHFNVW